VTGERRESVIGLLRKHGSLRPRELAAKLGLELYHARVLTKALLKEKLIAASGKTNQRTFHLPGHPPAKEAP
jgi:hypothetical protein